MSAKHIEKRVVVDIRKKHFERPEVAWPTVILSISSVSLWLWSTVAYLQHTISTPTAFFTATFAVFCSFTPLHDAVHDAVSPKYQWLNNTIGWLAGIPFMAPFPFFKFIHLLHHRHCNEGTAMDPDNYAGEGPAWQLPFRWATVFFWYLYYAKQYFEKRDRSTERPAQQKHLDGLATTMIRCLAFAVLMLLWMASTHGWAVWVCWLAPLFAASAWLMFVFDYLPHRPHVVPFWEDPYRATSVLVGPFSTWDYTLPMFCQNYHNIHHLLPTLPFYHYGLIWREYGDFLVSKGTRLLPIFASDSMLDELSQRA